MPPAEIGQLLAMKNMAKESLDQEIDDPLWHMTWEIKYSPMSLAYDFLWFRDIPNKRAFADKLLFEQEDGLAIMPGVLALMTYSVWKSCRVNYLRRESQF